MKQQQCWAILYKKLIYMREQWFYWFLLVCVNFITASGLSLTSGFSFSVYVPDHRIRHLLRNYSFQHNIQSANRINPIGFGAHQSSGCLSAHEQSRSDVSSKRIGDCRGKLQFFDAATASGDSISQNWFVRFAWASKKKKISKNVLCCRIASN